MSCTFAFNFCPIGYAQANGQLLPIAEFETLFNLIGTTFGGDGQATFALPDLQGRTPIGSGQAPGLSPFLLGQTGGRETFSLTLNNLPIHNHAATTIVTVSAILNGLNANGNSANPAGNALAVSSTRDNVYSDAAASGALSAQAVSTTAQLDTSISPAGGNQPFSTRSPYLALNYCISLFGIFPSQN